VATAALKRKKMNEQELDRLAGSRLQLEMNINTLESANLNAETMAVIKKASDALKVIHGGLYVIFPLLLIRKCILGRLCSYIPLSVSRSMP
jgi:hypothetical protein